MTSRDCRNASCAPRFTGQPITSLPGCVIEDWTWLAARSRRAHLQHADVGVLLRAHCLPEALIRVEDGVLGTANPTRWHRPAEELTEGMPDEEGASSLGCIPTAVSACHMTSSLLCSASHRMLWCSSGTGTAQSAHRLNIKLPPGTGDPAQHTEDLTARSFSVCLAVVAGRGTYEPGGAAT